MNDSLQRLLDSLNLKLAEREYQKLPGVAWPMPYSFEDYLKDNPPALTVVEQAWYNYIPQILKGVSIIFGGTVAGNAAALLLQLKGDTTLTQKPWYTSRSIWTNLVGALWIALTPTLGLPTLGTETEVLILGLINIILRIITKTEVTIS
jgi:hypothetical protein